MGSFSDWLENEFLDHVLGVGAMTATAATYVGLHIGDPLDTGAGGTGEVTNANAYARVAITWGAPASRAITQNAAVNFAEATGSWGTVDYWGIYDSGTYGGGNYLAHGALSASRSVVSGNTPSIASGQTTITVNAGKMSDYLAEAMLNHCFRNTSYTQPTIYVALVETTEITDAATGATIDELDMTNYAREAHANWTTASGGASSNSTSAIDFGTLSGTGETVTAACLTDNATKGAGNVLFYDNTPNQAIGTDDTVQFPIGDFDVSIA